MTLNPPGPPPTGKDIDAELAQILASRDAAERFVVFLELRPAPGTPHGPGEANAPGAGPGPGEATASGPAAFPFAHRRAAIESARRAADAAYRAAYEKLKNTQGITVRSPIRPRLWSSKAP